MNEIELLWPSEEMEKDVLDFKREFYDSGERTIFGSFKLDNEKYGYQKWLKLVRDNSKEETKDPRFVVMSTFFAVRKTDGRIVGIINLRHYLNSFYENSGSIGFSVRPSERRKGYAAEMLRLALKYAGEQGMREMTIVCKRDNEASRKTILRNGGVHSDYFTLDGIEYDRFRAPLP